jgi:hypothetical protein
MRRFVLDELLLVIVAVVVQCTAVVVVSTIDIQAGCAVCLMTSFHFEYTA